MFDTCHHHVCQGIYNACLCIITFKYDKHHIVRRDETLQDHHMAGLVTVHETMRYQAYIFNTSVTWNPHSPLVPSALLFVNSTWTVNYDWYQTYTSKIKVSALRRRQSSEDDFLESGFLESILDLVHCKYISCHSVCHPKCMWRIFE